MNLKQWLFLIKCFIPAKLTPCSLITIQKVSWNNCILQEKTQEIIIWIVSWNICPGYWTENIRVKIREGCQRCESWRWRWRHDDIDDEVIFNNSITWLWNDCIMCTVDTKHIIYIVRGTHTSHNYMPTLLRLMNSALVVLNEN